MLKEKVALVTGSTSGIGLAVAEGLARAGCQVMLNGLGSPEQITQAREQVAAHGGEVDYSDADLSETAQVEAMVAATEQRFGRIDILVNNAGIQHVARVEAFPAAKWDAIIAINLSAAFHAMRVALPGMQARGHGRIINIASVHGLVASDSKSAYVAAKHGIIGLTKVVALENAEADITCNAVCPGWVLTPLVQKQIDDRAAREGIPVKEAERALLAEKQPSLRFTRPEDIADAVRFLCGPGAGNMTGTTITLDGGWTAR
ncbi:3-hydroxybutyrate dehydrogenase [Pseudofulvimonas gallinarii]|uniref:3-hydroxybutyrate dehydrogenase n=1 Tax=Pseudofulvimonas gallinarii TaxID=634155 RepID=A0A4R3LEG1_9GAMM|nr:3-hydroxybutyrate dehydrogenase [Pseudofulvimonas gallinarii]TCS97785.1 3-hydroxybutyrate dehydrogenase [Pseudofulvimonas gallinarii]THD13408.1 3-hydroxybutyrate dehydrogenase [Pseudofulvimonas gallinarii]